ncbi:MAG TPA: hypothetical protein VKV74_03450 [Bryobacteraceae bacterium]|nr:hypothetical protein [Bryobacteraceae bacterium]
MGRQMDRLERECITYAAYLSGTPPTPYLVEKYLDFHQKLGETARPREKARTDAFDSFLVEVAARGALWTRLADSYARIFRPNSLLRKKLILVLALLECSPPSFERLDRVPAGGFAGAVLRLIAASVRFLAALIVGAALFGPVRLWMARRWNAS